MSNFKTNPFLKKGFSAKPRFFSETPTEEPPPLDNMTPLIVSDSVLEDNDQQDVQNEEQNQEENDLEENEDPQNNESMNSSAKDELEIQSPPDEEQESVLLKSVFEPESFQPPPHHQEPTSREDNIHSFTSGENKTISKEDTSLIEEIKKIKKVNTEISKFNPEISKVKPERKPQVPHQKYRPKASKNKKRKQKETNEEEQQDANLEMSKSDMPLNILTEKCDAVDNNEQPDDEGKLESVLPESLSAEKSINNINKAPTREPKQSKLKTKRKIESKAKSKTPEKKSRVSQYNEEQGKDDGFDIYNKENEQKVLELYQSFIEIQLENQRKEDIKNSAADVIK